MAEIYIELIMNETCVIPLVCLFVCLFVCSSNRRNLKAKAWRFSIDGKHFGAELFVNDEVTMIM